MIDSEGGCAEWVFPAAPEAVRTARSAVRGTLRGWGLDDVGDIAALLVSELVTNALRHATGPIGVRVVRRRPAGADGVLLVEVSDPLPDPPAPASPGPATRTAADCSWWPPPHAAGGPDPERRARRSGSNSPCPSDRTTG